MADYKSCQGIGYGILTRVVTRDDVIVIAAVRDPAKAAGVFASLPKGRNSSVVLVKIESTAEDDALAAARVLQEQHGITAVDIIIANAGIATHLGPVIAAQSSHLQEHFDINVLGPLRLFQAFLSLLEKSRQPKFIVVGSAIGSVSGMEKRPYPMFSYGASKAMVHYFIRKVHFEHENITTFAIDPGFVQTDTGNAGAKHFGMDEAPMPVASSAEFIVSTAG